MHRFPTAAGVAGEFKKNTQGEIQMREERSGVPDSAHRFDASRVRAGASTGVPVRKRVVCHTGVNENNPFLAIPRAHAPREGASVRRPHLPHGG